MFETKIILQLHPHFLIGHGGVRDVYQHPEDDDRCVKIVHNRSRMRPVKREARYLRRYEKQGVPFDRLTRFYGWTETNLGRGGVFDLIRDHDGVCSETLARVVAGTARRQMTPEEIVAQLTALYYYLLQFRVLVSDPALHNIVVHYRWPDKPILVIVDGVGNSDFIKLADYHTASAHRWIRKKWRRYIEVTPLLSEVFLATGYRPLTF